MPCAAEKPAKFAYPERFEKGRRIVKQEINLCPVFNYAEELAAYPGRLAGYLRNNDLDGVELYVYDKKPYDTDYRSETVGVHLRYWPSWLDFWLGNTGALAAEHQDEAAMRRYFLDSGTRAEWLEAIRANIRAGLAAEPEYFVWHVSQCRAEENFTFQFSYTDEEVIDATIEVFNAVSDAIPEHVAVLFENLWWPGLRLVRPEIVERLFKGIRHQNSGIMLDTGHLMNTNPDLRSEEEGVAYLCGTVRRLGRYKEYIRGIHLSCSLSGEYRRQDFSSIRQEGSRDDLMAYLMRHIVKLDQHRCFTVPAIRSLVELVRPEYLVHELFYDSMAEMAELTRRQQALLR